MEDVSVGDSCHAGRGVYAERDFAAGEPLLRFELRRIDGAEYRNLPPEEHLVVHSYSGRRYLYPTPARFVNHSDDPTCVEDFDRWCFVARRDLVRGDPITIDATQETVHELTTFLHAYRDARRSRSKAILESLIDDEAIHRESGGAVRGRGAVVDHLLHGYEPLVEVEWFVGTERWEAVCSATAGNPTQPAPVTAGESDPRQLATDLPTRRLVDVVSLHGRSAASHSPRTLRR